jgi:hypothetical protein
MIFPVGKVAIDGRSAKTSRRNPLISLGAAPVASSLCTGQEQRKMRESEVQIGNSG